MSEPVEPRGSKSQDPLRCMAVSNMGMADPSSLSALFTASTRQKLGSVSRNVGHMCKTGLQTAFSPLIDCRVDSSIDIII